MVTLRPAAPAPAAPDSACDYHRCALNIVPAWNGLAVVRGISGPRVAVLHFFWPRDVSAAIAGPDRTTVGVDSALAEARRAVHLRRIAAVLTDGGTIVAATAAVAALHAGRLRRGDAVLATVGGATLLVSIPWQFAADGALSRAVWWHNRRFAR